MDFTIVIPVHNGMPYIKDCIKSALAQDYSNFNIIILENMSDDGTAEYLDSLK
jgi:glycosyltransferase involved in cell wall biosynthesis